MKKCWLLAFMAMLLFSACSNGGYVGYPPSNDDNLPPTPRAWSIDELGEIIVAAGTFWDDWLGLWGRFDYAHIGYWQPIPELHMLGPGYIELLPSSGFAQICDIRNYLLQFYTVAWVDSQLNRSMPPFIEYNNTLYIETGRHCGLLHANWETATHTLIAQDGYHAYVESTLIFWWQEYNYTTSEFIIHPAEGTLRFTFINGRIHSSSRCPVCAEEEARCGRHASYDSNLPGYTLEPTTPRAWSIDELGETIVAAGTFWEDWWDLAGRFDLYYVGCRQYVPAHFIGIYAALLPASGFESLCDIRNYLLQFYTLAWVEAQLAGPFSPFIEYDNVLYIEAGRHCSLHPIWETATHTMIEQCENYTIVESAFALWMPEDGIYFDGTRRFTFINGRIHATSVCPFVR